ncbi:TetR/AcrR family transcriptional regulator [Flavobacterium sp. CF136]|jgi:AcrR family transcriptional regulator|uniref:TetR/AcrR family transcriptional regulator n=1 Tax=Flavobacterium sp. (strain CF136) TaxID=1144313 RepID=UPI000271B091|nr:TetR/AcrR family transcriptional regulator [Flavobacterium sp. CF136]EJL62363.1 transcriptional regulator [Flavobacterium sp. CF136]
MKDKIIAKASELFLKLGFKSVTMDDIAGEMCISKKTIYKYFCNKEVLIVESTSMVHKQVHEIIDTIVAKNHNAIHENFEIREMFCDMFKNNIDSSPIYQLKKHYPEIYHNIMTTEIDLCSQWFKENIEKGIREKLYREDLNKEVYVKFYYTLIFHINENTVSEKEAQKMELEALEYHTRAMATPEGITELEKQLKKITT